MAAEQTKHLDLLGCLECGAAALTFDSGKPDRIRCGGCGQAYDLVNGIFKFIDTVDDYTENYDQICKDDLEAEKTPSEIKAILAALIRERAVGVTCDLGCGDGYTISRVEAPRKMVVDIARAYLERLPDSITRIWGNVERTPILAQSIDTLVCTDVIEHVLDADALAQEIDRILKPTGRALLAFPFEQDLSVYELPEYKRKYGKYKYVHLRSIDDRLVSSWFPGFEVVYERLITDGMRFMEFKPYPVKFIELRRKLG